MTAAMVAVAPDRPAGGPPVLQSVAALAGLPLDPGPATLPLDPALAALPLDPALAALPLDPTLAALPLDPALSALWAELGITPALLAGRALRLHRSAPALVPAEGTIDDAPRLLAPSAATAWRSMRASAAEERIDLVLVSAWRSVERQAELIRQRLQAGEPLEQVLALIAPPGCSEHHTGRAIDIGAPGQPLLEQSFEATPAFAWLQRRAGHFGFSLSYPRGNAAGYAYEPWHWCHEDAPA